MECVNLDPIFHKLEFIVTLSKKKNAEAATPKSQFPGKRSVSFQGVACSWGALRDLWGSILILVSSFPGQERNNSRLAQWDASHSPFLKPQENKRWW